MSRNAHAIFAPILDAICPPAADYPAADEAPTVFEPSVRDLMFIAFWSIDHVRRMEAMLALGHLLGVERMDGYDALRKPEPESPAETRINVIIAKARQSEFAARVERSAGSNVAESDV